MSQAWRSRSRTGSEDVPVPHSALDADAVRAAYRRWAGIYDLAFGGVSAIGRRRAAARVNELPGSRVLEVGVGTGLALPHYRPGKRITGIDLSAEMLALARKRVADREIGGIDALLEMDAEAMEFPDGRFDIAVAMFVASVVPNPRLLLAEMRRVVKPGGWLVVVNHFARQDGPEWWQKFSVATTRRLGWRADFRLQDLFDASDLASAQRSAQWPFGMFQLIVLQR
jgi:phosphatidylethanolamine/phosphatidyl-N-methylethanolamine N-methyltransferase